MAKPFPQVMSLLVLLATRLRHAKRDVRRMHARRRNRDTRAMDRVARIDMDRALDDALARELEANNAFKSAKYLAFQFILHPTLRTTKSTIAAARASSQLQESFNEPKLTEEEIAFATAARSDLEE